MYETIVDKMFSDWLLSQLAKRDWTQTELANRSGLTKQAITNYVNGRIPDKTAINKIAAALKIPAEEVYRVAVGKPQSPDSDLWVNEMSHKLSLLTPGMRSVAERFINSMVEGEETARESRKPQSRPARKSSRV